MAVALTGHGRKEALAGVTAKSGFLGIFGFSTAGGEPKFAVTSNTAVGATLLNMTGAAAKGFTNGKIVVIRKLTASVTGLVAERAYYVVGSVTNGFELANEEGGAAIKVGTAEVTATTEIFLCSELTGGSYARVATTWGTPADDVVSDTAAEKVKVPAGFTVTDAFYHSKSSAGTNKEVMATGKLTEPEPYGSEGTYEVSSDKLEAPTTLA